MSTLLAPLAASTEMRYARVLGKYAEFVAQYNLPPLSTTSLERFLGSLVGPTTRRSDIDTAYWAVSRELVESGIDPQASASLQTVRKVLATQCRQVPPRRRLFISDRELRTLIDSLGSEPWSEFDRAAYLVAYAGALHYSALELLRRRDVHAHAYGVELDIQEARKKRTVRIRYHDDTRYCPVRALFRWMVVVSGDVVFPNDLLVDGLPSDPRNRLKRRLQALGLGGSHSGFASLRYGFIVTALRRGVDKELIRRQAGFTYLQAVERWEEQYSKCPVTDFFNPHLGRSILVPHEAT